MSRQPADADEDGGAKAAWAAGAYVRLTAPVAGLVPGSEGFVVGRYVNDDTVIVRFWDGGPLRVPGDALEGPLRPPPDFPER